MRINKEHINAAIIDLNIVTGNKAGHFLLTESGLIKTGYKFRQSANQYIIEYIKPGINKPVLIARYNTKKELFNSLVLTINILKRHKRE